MLGPRKAGGAGDAKTFKLPVRARGVRSLDDGGTGGNHTWGPSNTCAQQNGKKRSPQIIN